VIEFLEAAPRTAEGTTIATRMADWDGICDEASLGCAAYNAWQYRVQRDMFADYVPVGIDHVFDVTNLPSYRLTIEMSDLDGARIVITTGPGGQLVRPPLQRPDRAVAAR
jgi:hypothetical protein